MKVWLTPQEIADLAAAGSLPGLPKTKQNVNATIRREGWDRHHAQVRTRRDRGGTITEYHIDLLPLAARLAYAGSALSVNPADLVPVSPERDDPLSHGRKALDARQALLNVADRYARSTDLGTAAADHLFADLYNSGAVEVSDWIREEAETVSARTLARWRSDLKAGGPSVDPRGSRKGTGVLDRANGGQVRTLILAAIAKNPLLTAKHLRAFIRAQVGDTVTVESRSGARTVALPPLRTFQATISAWKETYKADLLLLTDPDRYKSTMRPSASGTTRAARLNECWEIDASPADMMTTAGRHSVYVAIDIYSRRMAVLVSDTPKAAAVGLLLRKCLVEWGVPERIKSDNGSDFVAHSTRRLIDTLGIEHEACDPYQPQQKGTVERAIGTFQRDLVRTLPGFIGHSVADRKVIENRKAFSKRLGLDDKHLFDVDLTPAELQDYADRWTREIYAHAPHEGLKRRTPFEVAAAYTGPVRRIQNEAALALLLAPIAGSDGYRTVTKKGIRVGGEHYWTSAAMPGTRVFCRHDPADLGRLIVFSEDGETWLGEAIAPELAGVDPAEMHARLMAERKAYHEGRLKDVRRETLAITPRTIVESQFQGRGTADLIAFPQASEPHTTPAIEAAAAAGRTEAPVDPKVKERREQLKREDSTGPARVLRLPTGRGGDTMREKRERFAKAKALEAQVEAGAPVPDEDRKWLAIYQRSAEYHSIGITEADRRIGTAG
tara:strand:- start:1568 stop:3739 length:2172 start_codon:yes stop_codon:yes gene_type:complete